MHDGPGGSGLSRKAIMEQIDASLTPAGHRLRRPLPDPPLRPGHPGRGDDGGAARRGEGRQGPLPRGLVDVGLAVRHHAARRRPRRLDPVRLDAEPVQPAPARGGAGDVRAARPPGRRQHPVEPAGQGPARAAVGRDRPGGRRTTPSSSGTTTRATPPIVAAVQAGSPRRAGCRWRRSRWPGCCATRWSPRRSSGRPRSTTSPTRSRRSTSSSPTTRSPTLEAPYTPRLPSGYS